MWFVPDIDRYREVLVTLGRNKLRTFLTGLGVFLGILILLIMVGFGRSMRTGVTRQFAGFASNAVFVWGQSTSMPYDGLAANRPVQFDNGDITAIRGLPGIEYVAPRNQRNGFQGGSLARYGTKTGSFQIAGDYPDFARVQAPLMRVGRFINELDITGKRKVCVIGETVADQLFEGADPIGKYIEAQGVYFEVVGMFGTRQRGNQGDRALGTIHIPFTTFQQAFNMGDEVGWFAITGHDDVSAEALEASVRALLAERHHIDPADTLALGSFNAGKQFGKMNALFFVINGVMWVAGIMTLLAGAIGVSNIMLISVRERTKEIGVRKALGATPSNIVIMIVTESLTLTVIAGYLGMVAGLGLLDLADRVLASGSINLPFGPPGVDLTLALVAGGVLAIAGGLAGVIPAYHAASIAPVEALRTE